MSARPALRLGDVVDWDVAAATGARLARPAPPMTDYTRRRAAAELTAAARLAEDPVRDVTGLVAADVAVPDARIVDRGAWVAAAAASMRAMTGAATGAPTDAPASSGRVGGALAAVRGRLTGVQTGAVLAFVSSGILGQYDPFGGGGAADGAAAAGTLLLVAPNVVAVERQLRVDPSDFRMWVCLHEVTHRVQFTTHPWLARYMAETLGTLLSDDAGDTDLAGTALRVAAHVRRRRDPAAGDTADDGVIGLLRALQSEPQTRALDRLLVLGTLLEGHADHVMDAVGPRVVPSVATIRRRFEQRRGRARSPVQKVLRALLGVEAKTRQYTRGKAFVDAAVAQVGMARFNTVWTGPETLPLPAEIDEPRRWVDRVL